MGSFEMILLGLCAFVERAQAVSAKKVPEVRPATRRKAGTSGKRSHVWKTLWITLEAIAFFFMNIVSFALNLLSRGPSQVGIQSQRLSFLQEMFCRVLSSEGVMITIMENARDHQYV